MANDSFSFGSINSSINKALNKVSKSLNAIATGYRINKASDDAAGLAIAEGLKSEVAQRSVANRNAQDAESAVQIADSALGQVGDITARLSELATQASNGTLSDTQRSALQSEFNSLTQEAQRIGATTSFNGKQLLDGSSTTAQVGITSDANSQISVGGTDLSSLLSNLSSQNIGTQAGAQAALGSINDFTSQISQARGNLGASEARIQTASDVNLVARENAAAAESRIRDLDIAQETADLTRNKILAQSGTALQAQAGRLKADTVLNLLK